jgi:hypothetical protein
MSSPSSIVNGQKLEKESITLIGPESKDNDSTHTTPNHDTASQEDDEDTENWHGGPWSQDEVRSQFMLKHIFF